MRRLLSATCLALTLAPCAVEAAVRYDFTALQASTTNGETVVGSFSVTLPSFVSGGQIIAVSELNSCQATSNQGSASCLDQWLLPTQEPGYDTIAFSYTSPLVLGVHNYYYFNDGVMGAYGTYSTVMGDDHVGTLVVSQVGAVPEPATALSLMAGLLGLSALRRRRR